MNARPTCRLDQGPCAERHSHSNKRRAHPKAGTCRRKRCDVLPAHTLHSHHGVVVRCRVDHRNSRRASHLTSGGRAYQTGNSVEQVSSDISSTERGPLAQGAGDLRHGPTLGGRKPHPTMWPDSTNHATDSGTEAAVLKPNADGGCTEFGKTRPNLARTRCRTDALRGMEERRPSRGRPSGQPAGLIARVRFS